MNVEMNIYLFISTQLKLALLLMCYKETFQSENVIKRVKK